MARATCIATAVERRRPLPVDAMVPDPIVTSTHAITIDAPCEAFSVAALLLRQDAS
jgi:hypothetical protein